MTLLHHPQALSSSLLPPCTSTPDHIGSLQRFPPPRVVKQVGWLESGLIPSKMGLNQFKLVKISDFQFFLYNNVRYGRENQEF